MKIFLIGMMGSGKSFWKQQLAKLCKTSAYDLDFIIEAEEEKTISEIFEENGEAYFRKSEAKILRWFGEKKAYILATGGGTPCFHENMDWMNKEGITIWIDETLDTLVSRLISEKEHRPLIAHLNGIELYQFLENKLAERSPYYLQCTHHLQGEAIQLNIFKKIIKSYA